MKIYLKYVKKLNSTIVKNRIRIPTFVLVNFIFVMPINQDIRALFLLNPEITFLNFGSFGATPKPIFEKYIEFQKALESDPVQFITLKTPGFLKASREALGLFLHCYADDLVMVPNPSYAVNTIAKSLQLKPNDEILTTNLEYGACDRTWDFICDNTGSKYVQQTISLPLTTEEKFVEELFSGVTNNTKLIFISHITSATALILPVDKVIQKAKTLNIPVFVDGAHVPGHISLNIQSLDPDFYTGACHKWMLTPKGSSFMYVKRALQPNIKPLVVSWGFKALKPSHSQFLDWHEITGTLDYAARLCIPEAIQFRTTYDWDNVAIQSRKLAHDNAQNLANLLESQLLAPVNDTFLGQMISVPIRTKNPEQLYQKFVHDHKIEIPIMQQNGTYHIRYSINGFNTQSDLDRLFDVIATIKKKGLLH